MSEGGTGQLLPVETFFFPSQAQSNTYNLTTVRSNLSKDQPVKYDLLVAYYRPVAVPSATKECCMIYRFSSPQNGDEISTTVKSVDFLYLPGDADIVCIHALWDEDRQEHMVGIGFVTDQGKCYLNIYGSQSQDQLSECYVRYLELPRIPLQLTHTYYLSPSTKQLQWAFLLSCGRTRSGSGTSGLASSKDPHIYVFAPLADFPETECTSVNGVEQDCPGTCASSPVDTNIQLFGELNHKAASGMFPELANLPDVTVLHMDFVILSKHDPPTRLAAFGAQNGWFCVMRVDMVHRTVLQRLEFSHDTTITHVQLFSSVVCPEKVDELGHSTQIVHFDDADLLVCSAFETSVVYHNVFQRSKIDLSNQFILPQSADFDHVNCASVGDFDFDGQIELVLGTFGQRLLFYRWQSENITTGVADTRAGSYVLVKQHRLIGPAHSLSAPLDLIGDGLQCLVLLTGRGIHVYRHAMELDLLKLVEKRLFGLDSVS